MKLILSKLDISKKIIIIYSIPNQNISDEIQTNLKNIYDKVKDIKIEEKYFDFESYLSYLFEIKSAWYPDTNETLLLTLYLEEHENTHLFKDIMKDCVLKMKNIPSLSKILYLNTPHADSDAYGIFGKVIQLLTSCFFEASKIHATYNLGIAEILILGSKGGGKTSIVDYLIHHKPIIQSSPTLTPQIYNLVYENYDFRVLDVCCNEHIKQVFEDHPLEPGKLPQAIVYVVDASLIGRDQISSINDFNEWIDYLSKLYPKNVFRDIPILVLFNKTDLNPNFNEIEFQKLYHLKHEKVKSKYNEVSALTGEGLDENFSWLLKEIMITKKF
jgi:GTPase SAR1 family protein